MSIFLFIIGGILGVVWLFNLFTSGIGTGLQALQAFIGAALCLGLGEVIRLMKKESANS